MICHIYLVLGACIFSLGSHNLYCLVADICQAYVVHKYWTYVLGICMHGMDNNSLIRLALSVVRLLAKLLEAF